MPTRTWRSESPFGAQLFGVALELLLHPQRRVERALRMVFMRDRRTEHREDAVAGGLHDVPVVAMSGVDHQLQRRIDDGARLFGIEILHQIHRTLDVGEQRRDRLAIAVPHFLQNRALGLSDALHDGQVSTSFEPHDSQNDASA